MARFAACWALWGDHAVPPGDIGVIAFVSLSRDEASSRIRTIASVLTALGVGFEQRADEIELGGKRPVVFKVFACNTSAVVGFTSIAVFCDEAARWESRDAAANAAREIVASLAPTMATQPSAFMVLSSSPWSLDDYHAELFDQGETTFQAVSFAPTWVANPTITEEQTHELEPDLRVWIREYGACPSQSVSAAFEAKLVLPCFAREVVGTPQDEGWVAVDPSSLRNRDGFGFMVGRLTDRNELLIDDCGEFTSAISLRLVAKRIAMYAQRVNTTRVYSDQREQAGLRSELERHGIELIDLAWSETSKQEAVEIMNRWFYEARVSVSECPGAQRLRSELLAVKARAMPSGRTQYKTTGLDVASCLITLAHAVDRGEIVIGNGNPMLEALDRIVAERAQPGYRPPVTPELRARGWA